MRLSELESIRWMDKPNELRDMVDNILYKIYWLFDVDDLKVVDSSLIYSMGNSIDEGLNEVKRDL